MGVVKDQNLNLTLAPAKKLRSTDIGALSLFLYFATLTTKAPSNSSYTAVHPKKELSVSCIRRKFSFWAYQGLSKNGGWSKVCQRFGVVHN